MEQLTLQLNSQPCAVCVGPGLLEQTGALLRRHAPGVRRWALVADETASALYGDTVRRSLLSAGLSAGTFPVPAGEQAKTPEAYLSLCRRLVADGFRRDWGIVTLGGGACGDSGGFAAATLLRGVPLAHIPTTLLAQADSSIGGKTALDLPEGKNLLGAFCQPLVVVSDPVCLTSLPRRQFASGMAEVIKTGCVADESLLAAVEAGLSANDCGRLTSVITACCRAKGQLVSADPTDRGVRRLLNFGHTFGHGYEALGGYARYTHGEAVAAGMCRMLRWQASHGYDGTLLARLEPLLARYGLPTSLPCDEAALRPLLNRDKKTADAAVTLAIVEQPGHGHLITVPPEALWEAAV